MKKIIGGLLLGLMITVNAQEKTKDFWEIHKEGMAQLNEESYEDAIITFKKLLEQASKPDQKARSNYCLGLVYLKTEKIAQAEEYLTLVIDNEEASEKIKALATLKMGQVRYWQERYEEALKFINKGLECKDIKKDDAQWEYSLRANCLNKTGDFKGALKDCKKILDSKNAPVKLKGWAMCSQAVAYKGLKQKQKALKILNQVLQLEGLPEKTIVRATNLKKDLENK